MSIAKKAIKAYLASKFGDRGAEAILDVITKLSRTDPSAADGEDFHTTVAAIPAAQRVAKTGFYPLPALHANGKRQAIIRDRRVLDNPDLKAAMGPLDQWELIYET